MRVGWGLCELGKRVLHLDGFNSYVELPPDLFVNRTQATVEAWVKIAKFKENAHFLDFGSYQREMYLGNEGMDPALKLLITDGQRARHRIILPDLLATDRWIHLAAVTGPSGVRLYYNGMLVGTNVYAGGLAGIGAKDNSIGRSSSSRSRPVYFQGEIDDVRIWGTERSASEIRESLFRVPAATEADLIGHWNFDDGSAQDRGAAGRHGRLMGNAVISPATGPTP